MTDHLHETSSPDRDALRRRYRTERDKRIRPDGSDQYIEPTGRFSNLMDDPYTEVVPREPVIGDVGAVVVGAGFGGLAAAAKLRQAGLDDVRLVDRAGDVGGVWYWNRYPGAMCDTAALIYLPMLEEVGTVPSAKYVSAPEILQHAQRLARTFHLYDGALFSTGITSVEWQHDTSRWRVRTDRGDDMNARFVVLSTGPLHRAKLPGIPGIELFGGHAFHTSRWDYAYTGGDPAGAPMTGLASKRVGVIGTGATAVQVVPHLGEVAEKLYVFQRTPSSVDERNNQPIDPAWFASLAPGWQREWMTNFTVLQTGGFTEHDLVEDGWTDISQRIRDRVVAMVSAGADLSADTMQRAYEDSDDDKMNEIRARVDRLVDDPATAAALKPWYRQLCKRPCFHDDYLQTFNRPNVELVDTDGQGVSRIDETGVWVGERHVELDCIVFASGFEVGTALSRRTGFEVLGEFGTLSEHWSDGMRTLHGVHVHGFPNLFIVGLTQAANLLSNIPHNLVEAAETVACVVGAAVERSATTVSVSAAAEQAWVELIDTGGTGVFGNPECTPGYYNNEGGPIGVRERRNSAGHPGGPIAYFDHIAGWRRSGHFDGLEFGRRSP